MVVEDEERVRAYSVEALKELGYAVIEASSRRDALRMIESGMPMSLLFTDVVMPEMNGRQLAERAAKIRPGLKVLYTTGYTGNAALSNGLLDPGHDLRFQAIHHRPAGAEGAPDAGFLTISRRLLPFRNGRGCSLRTGWRTPSH